jgi:hypothetical protein
MRDVTEFTLVYLESIQEWVVILGNGSYLRGGWGSVGYAHGAALNVLGRGEYEFDEVESSNNYSRYEQDETYWRYDNETT